jgi:hypothetical protein
MTCSAALCLKVRSGSTWCLHWLTSAMPALRHLEVQLLDDCPGDGGLIPSLHLCPQLTALHLEGLHLNEDSAVAASATLARLPNLRELGLGTATWGAGLMYTPLPAVLKHLTALTSLRLRDGCSWHSSAPLYAAAIRNPGLLSFSVSHDKEAPAGRVQHLLEALPSLTHLGLDSARVQQEALDVILTHGTRKTSLRAGSINPSTSMAGRQVSWRGLVLTDGKHPSKLHLANLPLQSVTSLQLSSDAWLGSLELPTHSVQAADLPGLLLQATTNLAGCPAWRSAPDSWVTLQDDSSL